MISLFFVASADKPQWLSGKSAATGSKYLDVLAPVNYNAFFYNLRVLSMIMSMALSNAMSKPWSLPILFLGSFVGSVPVMANDNVNSIGCLISP